jgi:Mn-dependent DtxR family transcriptional regulator
MDTELARTFLVVVATGSFVEAAQRLHVTQSTVSTRIQRLEETLGAELFVRNKAGTTLTSAGQQFQRHAALLTRTVEQARQEIGLPQSELSLDSNQMEVLVMSGKFAVRDHVRWNSEGRPCKRPNHQDPHARASTTPQFAISTRRTH